MKFKKALVAVAATTAALGGVIGGATSASAATYGCGSTGPNNSDGELKVVVGHLRNGPFASCAQTLSVAGGTAFHAWCGVYNTSGNFWVYGRVGTSQTKGWIYSENLSLSSGSVNIC
jgi:hypothetical protein